MQRCRLPDLAFAPQPHRIRVLGVRDVSERDPPVNLSEDQLESNPAVPRGSLESKPTWRNA